MSNGIDEITSLLDQMDQKKKARMNSLEAAQSFLEELETNAPEDLLATVRNIQRCLFNIEKNI